MKIGKIILYALGFVSFFSDVSFCEEINVRTPSGTTVVVEVESDAPFNVVLEQIQHQMVANNHVEERMSTEHLLLDFMTASFFPGQGSPLAQSKGRSYGNPMNASEKADLTYILYTLAATSMPKLLLLNSDLKKAGARIDHVHPLRFWATIFTSEELKGYIHAMRDRKKIWKEFMSGCSDTLDEEANNQNLKSDYIADFARTVGIDVNAVSGSLKQKKWNDFVDTLTEKIKRTGDTNRYDQ